MILHAISYEQKKAQAFHIVNGMICKNCEHYNIRIQYCHEPSRINIQAVKTYSFCSEFKRKQST